MCELHLILEQAMKTFSRIFGFSILASTIVLGQVPDLSKVTVTSRSLSTQAAENLSSAYDAGDGYQSARGPRSFLRLAGAFSVRIREGHEGLTNPGGPFAGFRREAEGRGGFILLRAHGSRRDRGGDTARLNE